MPQSLSIGVLVLGGVLLLIAIIGGGFKIFGAEVADKISNTPLRLLSGALGICFIFLALSPSFNAAGLRLGGGGSSEPPASSTSPPSRFYFNYQNNPNERHDMYRSNNSRWIEQTPDGGNVFTFAQRTTVDGNTGTVLAKQGEQLFLFVPDKNATGTNRTWLRMSGSADGPWSYFQLMLGIQ
jgi:hypothetical protein